MTSIPKPELKYDFDHINWIVAIFSALFLEDYIKLVERKGIDGRTANEIYDLIVDRLKKAARRHPHTHIKTMTPKTINNKEDNANDKI